MIDGVYDDFGRWGHGPGGIGPVFHHGMKNPKDVETKYAHIDTNSVRLPPPPPFPE